MQRRDFMTMATGAAWGATAAADALSADAKLPNRSYRRIATEEGWLPEAVLRANARYAAAGGKVQVMTRNGPAPKAMVDAAGDIGPARIAAMDRDGIDMQLLLLSSPGVQIFSAEEGSALAREANDELAEAVRHYPTRYAGLAALAPQDSAGAVRELQRAINTLKLSGAIINSHTQDEYLSDRKYWPILEAVEALDVPLYLHPRDPATRLSASNVEAVTAAGWAYGVEVGTHLMQMIGAGVFDRFPRLKIVVGHMGEAIPFWLPRIDNRYLTGPRPLRRKPSEYVLNNVWVTTSGMNYEEQLKLTLKVMGPERVLYAVDYPFEDQADAVRLLEAMSLTHAQKQRLCEENAVQLFRLGRRGV
jgi:5-carboxyvanillate decarboxylase